MVQNHPQMMKWVFALLPVGFVFGIRTLPPSGEKAERLLKRWSWTLVVKVYFDFFFFSGFSRTRWDRGECHSKPVYSFILQNIVNETVYFWGNAFKWNVITVYITYFSLLGVTRIAWEAGEVMITLSFAKTYVFNAASHLLSLCQIRPLLSLTSGLI